jgi:hypothetical protein
VLRVLRGPVGRLHTGAENLCRLCRCPLRPTVFLGSRGAAGFTLRVRLWDRSYHSGNSGRLLRNPATALAGAVAPYRRIGAPCEHRRRQQGVRILSSSAVVANGTFRSPQPAGDRS